VAELTNGAIDGAIWAHIEEVEEEEQQRRQTEEQHQRRSQLKGRCSRASSGEPEFNTERRNTVEEVLDRR